MAYTEKEIREAAKRATDAEQADGDAAGAQRLDDAIAEQDQQK